MLGSFIDRVDARAWQYVMKFVQQEDFPQPAKCIFRVQLLPSQRSERGSRFRLNKRVLQLAVQQLSPTLSSESGRMVFQVFFADPYRQRPSSDILVELGDAADSQIWHSREISKPAIAFQHLRGRTTPSIPVTECQQRTRVVLFSPESPPGCA